MEDSIYLIILLFLEVQDFPFLVHNKAEGHRLYTAGGELRLDFPPEHRREFESDQPVQDPSCLLCVHEIHVDFTRRVDGMKYGRSCNLMEHNPSCVFFLESESIVKMPADGLSLPVFIGCEPYCSS